MKSRLLSYIAICTVFLIPAGQAQNIQDQALQGQGALAGIETEGPQLYQLSIYSGYATSASPYGAGQLLPPGVGSLSADENYGAGVSAGWQHHRERGSFSMRYSGTYNGMVHYSSVNGYSQSLAINADRKLTPKLELTFTASGADDTLIQLLNEQPAPSVIAQLPSNFDDFAAANGLGNFSSAQAASAILGAPVLETPLSASLLGLKELIYSGNLGLNYSYSPHVSFHIDSLASGGQNLSGNQNQFNYLVPLGLGGDAGMSWSYSTSPRTQLGFNLDGNSMRNRFEGFYAGTATASFGRKMGMHWFLKGNGGVTITQITQQYVGTPRTRQIIGGGSLGFKTYTNSFLGAYNRAASDGYGFVGTYTTLSGSWNHHRPGSRWSMSANFSQQQMRDTGFESLSGWAASGGITEKLSDRTEMQAQYVYFSTWGRYLETPSSFSMQSVRLSMNWTPHPVQR